MCNMYDILVRLRSLAACFRNGYCPGFGEWVTIHNRILADSSALAQKASRCAVSLSEMAQTAVKSLLNGDNAPANISLPVHFAPGGTTRE